jgi:chemotaxis protein MotD
MLAGGAATKPAKPGASAAAPAPDGTKSQSQSSAAAALAEISTAASHTFASQQVSSAHALPLHTGTNQNAGDPPTGDSQNGNAQSGRQNNTANGSTTSASATTDAIPQPAFTPAHSQPVVAAQPEAPTAAVTAAAPTQPPAVSASPQTPVQLQVMHAPNANEQPFVGALAVTIAAKSEGGAKHFDIRLDPAELGRVDVRLTVDDAGKAQATLSVEKPQTLELLQKDSTHLERALKDAGLDLSQNGLNFSLKGQQQQGGNGNNTPSQRARNLAVRAITAANNAISILPQGSVSASDTRLDIRV